MRVLIATDGSTPAQTALELASHIEWPRSTVLRVVTAVESPVALYGAPWAPALPGHVDRLEAELVAHGESILEAAARAVSRTGCTVERSLLRGRPGSIVIEEASSWQADVVIVGSRGHGVIASMVLGSVSAEIVDQAPCPVLVSRVPRLTRVVLGHDGSEFAIAAERVVGSWPIFEKVAVEVVSVAPVTAPWRSGIGPTIYGDSLGVYLETEKAATSEHTQVVEEAARRLAEDHRRTSTIVASGDPATEIVRLADEHEADLIVVGTHGRSGIARALLGSVARNVLQHASCSVMVVRQTHSRQGRAAG